MVKMRMLRTRDRAGPGSTRCVVFLGKTLSFTRPLSTQVYKMGRWTSTPCRGVEGVVEIPIVASRYVNRNMKLWWHGRPGQTFISSFVI